MVATRTMPVVRRENGWEDATRHTAGQFIYGLLDHGEPDLNVYVIEEPPPLAGRWAPVNERGEYDEHSLTLVELGDDGLPVAGGRTIDVSAELGDDGLP